MIKNIFFVEIAHRRGTTSWIKCCRHSSCPGEHAGGRGGWRWRTGVSPSWHVEEDYGVEVDRFQHQLSLSHFQGKFWIFTPVFRIRFFSPDLDQSPDPDFAKNLDPIRKNPDPDTWKKRPKTGVKVESIVITYLDLSILSFLVGQAPPKP